MEVNCLMQALTEYEKHKYVKQYYVTESYCKTELGL